jgi:hypothetical protein
MKNKVIKNMKKMDSSVWKTATLVALTVILLMSGTQAAVNAIWREDSASFTVDNTNHENIPQSLTYDDGEYLWEDDFNNQQLIEDTLSENYNVQDGEVVISDTYPSWTDSAWTRMKPITLTSTTSLSGYAIKLIVEYDSDMRADYGDLRFKLQNDGIWLDYWIEEINPDPNPNNKYAIVWLKLPSIPPGQSQVYMFYGNPSATDQGDYWALFDEGSWDNEYAHDYQVTYHMQTEMAQDPDVAFSGDRFLITWEEGTTPFTALVHQQQIRGCFFNRDGTQMGNRFDITEEETPPYRYENPSVASSGSNFFVAFEHYNTPLDAMSMDIEGAIVNFNGGISRFDICTASNCQADPCVAFDDQNNRYFVVWEDARAGVNNYDVIGKLFSSSGSPIGSDIVIASGPNSQCEPWIAYDSINEHYIVVWEEGVDPEDGPFSIYMQIYDGEGNGLLANPKLLAQGTTSVDYNWPCVANCDVTERFLITWQQDDISNEDYRGDIWGTIVNADGSIAVSTFKIANGEFRRTDIVPYLSSSFFVAFDGGGDIWGKLVSSDGEVIPYTIRLSDSDTEPADWVNLAVGDGKIFVSWEDRRMVYVPFNDLSDIFANVWSFKIPSESAVTISIGQEKQQVLNGHIVSVKINPDNLEEWMVFDAEKTGDINFDILDGNSLQVIRSDVSPGSNIESVQASSIRLRARLSRTNPSSTPSLDKWSVSYVGRDDEPPRTTLDNIDGEKGLNDWYISEGVTVWLRAEDFPEDTGSGVDVTYYTLNGGSSQIYNTDTGIQLGVSQSSNWMGQWNIRFWSVDKKGNIENSNKPENQLSIKIDADPPYVEILEPADEEKVEVPFWVRASASDNADIDRVEFDIEPFGEREGLPFKDYDPPYEWYCDVDQKDILLRSLLQDPRPLGVNVMVRAQVYDSSGQTKLHQVWVHITNWEFDRNFDNNLCIIVAVGSGVVSTGRFSMNSFTIGDISWDYSSGYVFSAGLGGVYSTAGAHTGDATSFIGFADSNMIVGLTGRVSVRQ